MGLLEKYTDRIQEMHLGIRELESWLLDTVDQGLAKIPTQSADTFEDIASRLVDLKLGAIANRIRNLEQLRHNKDWREKTSALLAELYYFTRRFSQIEQLPDEQKIDLLVEGGVNLKKKDVLQIGESISDYWIVLGLEMGREERLRYRRTWLWSESQQKPALILDFAFGEQEFEGYYTVGAALKAKVTYYPGSTHTLRAVLQDAQPSKRTFANLQGEDSLSAFSRNYTAVLGETPATMAYPLLLNKGICFTREGSFYLSDEAGYYLELDIDSFAGWRLVAMSGGIPIMVFATYDGSLLRPLSAIVQQRVVQLSSSS
ncbi:MAG TPA: hypothetical protein VJ953_10860 [Saprospiraceae bacterium]|nr:hypothetical protein [Saprospiraceae bacterium]